MTQTEKIVLRGRDYTLAEALQLGLVVGGAPSTQPRMGPGQPADPPAHDPEVDVDDPDPTDEQD